MWTLINIKDINQCQNHQKTSINATGAGLGLYYYASNSIEPNCSLQVGRSSDFHAFTGKACLEQCNVNCNNLHCNVVSLNDVNSIHVTDNLNSMSESSLAIQPQCGDESTQVPKPTNYCHTNNTNITDEYQIMNEDQVNRSDDVALG